MSTLRRFLFETSFDDDRPMSEFAQAEGAESELDQEAAPEEAPPTFSKEELTAATEQAFAAGREEGLRTAGDAIEQRSSETLSAIAEKLEVLLQGQQAAAAAAARDATAVAVAIVRKLFPALAERNAVEEVEHLVAEAMELVRDEPRVVIRVHESLRDTLAARIEALTVRYGFEGQIVLTAGEGLGVAAGQVEWARGGAARDADALWREMEQIVARNLGPGALLQDDGGAAHGEDEQDDDPPASAQQAREQGQNHEPS